jgi:hypothetical protein
MDIIYQADPTASGLQPHPRCTPKGTLPATNAIVDSAGKPLRDPFIDKHLRAVYPHFPTHALKAAVIIYIGRTTCAAVACEMGVTPLLQQHCSGRTRRPRTRYPRTTCRSATHPSSFRDLSSLGLSSYPTNPKPAPSITVDKFG